MVGLGMLSGLLMPTFVPLRAYGALLRMLRAAGDSFLEFRSL
jgi:hypothetical protein